MGYKGRDVEVTSLNETQCVVVSCDSCGGIGSKELDVIKSTPYITGRLTVRVSLMEVISTGAEPKIISVAVSNEPYPTGEGIIEGVKGELECMGLSSVPMAISTEKNIPTRQTAVGITVVGICEKEKLRVAASKSGDTVYCLGIPKVGNEISGVDDKDIVQIKHIQELINAEGIHDILPVGSRGILKEAETLACSVNSTFLPEHTQTIDVNKSAGPSTCLIFTCFPDGKLSQFNDIPLIKIGRLE